MTTEDSTATDTARTGETPGAAARRRAAVELVARHGAALRQTAGRYSICAEDAEDAYQRALEILLTKAPTVDHRELIRWTQTVTKHEALAVRRKRERLLGATTPRRSLEDPMEDWVELIPSPGAGPAERVERNEVIARSREALQALKPAELRALTLLAEGYSYAEISQITGFSATKVNRCLAEGRERFRKLVSGMEAGSRCAEMGALISAFCDGELGDEEERTVREHLRACSACRATMRSYRAAAPAAAALTPSIPATRSLLERLGDLVGELQTRLPGGAEPALTGAAAGGAKGVGVAGLAAKALAVCGAAGGVAVCAVTGVVPAPNEMAKQSRTPSIERVIPAPTPPPKPPQPIAHEPPAPPPTPGRPEAEGEEQVPPAPEEPEPEPTPVESGAVEYSPPPEPEPAAAPAPAAAGGGGAAGEFGP